MSFFRRAAMTLGGALALASGVASADVVPYYYNQGPKPDLSNPAPPDLVPAMASKIAQFNSKITQLGNYGFELPGNYTQPGSSGFGYTGGTASAFGSFALAGEGLAPDLTVGRYNMTPGLVETDPFGNSVQHIGHWIESSGQFGFNFTGAPISAIGFFLTDLGDFAAALTIELFNGGDRVYTSQGDPNLNLFDGQGANGNLRFVGLTSDTSFDRIVFNVAQSTATPETDFIGLDSLIVGTVNGTGPLPVPEPGTLALVGLALAGAGFARRQRPAR